MEVARQRRRGAWSPGHGSCSVMTVVHAAVEARVRVAALAVTVGSAVASTVADWPPLADRMRHAHPSAMQVAVAGLVVGARVVLLHACVALACGSCVERSESLRLPIARGASRSWIRGPSF